MIITEKVIPHIEKAMGFKLYDHQKYYLLDKGGLKGGRGTGKTFAYCIKLALSDSEPIDLRKMYEYSDGWGLSDRRRYAQCLFRGDFLMIRGKLKNCGFPVRNIIGGK